MPLNIRSEEVNVLAERLATRKHISKTAAVRLALLNELAIEEAKLPLRERLRDLQAEVRALGRTGLDADKAFYDELSGEF